MEDGGWRIEDRGSRMEDSGSNKASSLVEDQCSSRDHRSSILNPQSSISWASHRFHCASYVRSLEFSSSADGASVIWEVSSEFNGQANHFLGSHYWGRIPALSSLLRQPRRERHQA